MNAHFAIKNIPFNIFSKICTYLSLEAKDFKASVFSLTDINHSELSFNKH